MKNYTYIHLAFIAILLLGLTGCLSKTPKDVVANNIVRNSSFSSNKVKSEKKSAEPVVPEDSELLSKEELDAWATVPVVENSKLSDFISPQ